MSHRPAGVFRDTPQSHVTVIRRFFFLPLRCVVLGLLATAGCADSQPAPSGTPRQPAAAQGQPAPLAERETWEVHTIQGTRVGYGRTRISYADQSGRKVLRVEGSQHLAVQRFGQRTQQEIRFESVETPEGKLLEFQSEIQQGSTPLRTTGRVVGERLELETATQGKQESTSLAWSAEYGGFAAAEQSLLRQPLQPGGRRTLRALVLALNQVATIEMTARRYEPTRLGGGTCELLRIDTLMHFADGQTLPTVVWCDRTGDTLKSRIEAMGLESFRATRAEALEKTDAAGFDLGWDLSVKLDRPPPRAADLYAAKRIRYRVELPGGDPAAVFVSGPSQQIASVDPHTAELTVYAIRPGQDGGNPAAPHEPPSPEDLQSNNLIQSDDAGIVAMAREAAGDESDPWQTALRLEQYVNRSITKKDFSQAFATAAEVAQKPEGDCTEHAVLLAALCRARGIPARVAIGLVYMRGSQSFGYHMWNEVCIGTQWFPIDATLAQGGIGPTHLKLAHSSLKGASAYSSFLPVIQVAGRLRIEIVEVK